VDLIPKGHVRVDQISESSGQVADVSSPIKMERQMEWTAIIWRYATIVISEDLV
jgi:hypothetical protein